MNTFLNKVVLLNLNIVLALFLTNAQAALYSQDVISYWKFDEGSGAIVYDSINSYHGIINNGANWTTGVAGSALSFDGLDDYVRINNYRQIFPLFINNLTVELWLKMKGSSPIRTYNGFIGDGWGNWGNVNFNFAYDNINRRWDLWDSSLGRCPGLEDMGYVYQDIGYDWNHVAITFSSHIKSLYVNGQLIQSDPVCTNAATYVQSSNLYIGASPGDQQYINAIIDEVAIYNRALTVQEIQQHYQNGLNGQSLGDGGGIIFQCKYVGTFQGIYSGDDRGTWRASINDNCELSGKAKSVDGSLVRGTGSVTSEGGFTMVAGSTNVGVFSGQMYDNGSISGTWSNDYWGEHGRFKGKSISLPKILKLSQNKGKPGEVITITGNNFWFAQGKVLFGTRTADIYDWNSHSIIVAVPQMKVGKKGKTISIKLRSLNGKSSAGKKFRVLPMN